jgi:hypothetical protein
MHHEESSLPSNGLSTWTVTQGFTQESKAPLPWTFDEEGNMQLAASDVPALTHEAKEIINEDLVDAPKPEPDLLHLFQRTVKISEAKS